MLLALSRTQRGRDNVSHFGELLGLCLPFRLLFHQYTRAEVGRVAFSLLVFPLFVL